MEIELTLRCAKCGGAYSVSSRTRRRVIYKCDTCGKELPIRKQSKKPTNKN